MYRYILFRTRLDYCSPVVLYEYCVVPVQESSQEPESNTYSYATKINSNSQQVLEEHVNATITFQIYSNLQTNETTIRTADTSLDEPVFMKFIKKDSNSAQRGTCQIPHRG